MLEYCVINGGLALAGIGEIAKLIYLGRLCQRNLLIKEFKRAEELRAVQDNFYRKRELSRLVTCLNNYAILRAQAEN